MKNINLLQPLILTWLLTMSITFITIDSSGQNIGIGTDTPSDKLHIYGGDLRIEDNYPFIFLNKLSTSTNTGINFKENDVSKGFLTYTGLEDVLRMTTDADGLRNDLVITDLGKVCIGTFTPYGLSQLHVSGGDIAISDESHPFLILNSLSINNDAGMKMQENGNNAAWFYFKGANNTLHFSNHMDGSRNDLAIASDGKVGIGTEAPNNRLHVFGGDLEIEDYYPYLILNDTATNGGKAGLSFRYQGANQAILYHDNSGEYFKMSTDDNGTRNDFIIDSLGNIGFGTLSPAVKLHVNGGDVQIDDNNPFLFIRSLAADTNFGIAFKEISTYKGWLYYDSFDEVLRMTTASSGFRNDIVIAPNGRVGIGTMLPEEALHVEGTIEVDQKIQANDIGGLDFATADGTIRLKMQDDGNFGMGTLTVDAGSRLHISGGDLTVEDTPAAFLYLDATSSTGTAGVLVKQNGTNKGWFHYSDASDVLRISTDVAGGRNDLTINPSGNVGIGTSTPGERLHVKATGAAKIRVEGSGSNVLSMEFFDLSTFGGSVGYSITNDYLFFYHGGNVIVKNGSMGVGQTTIGVGRKIDVSGGAYCSGTTWVNSSDRSLKENLVPVSGQLILEKIQDLDITSWNYREEGTDIRHIGPMAKDFYSLFEVGYDETSISTLDADGISLAAIKALAMENRELKEKMAEMEQRLLELEGLATNAFQQNSPSEQP